MILAWYKPEDWPRWKEISEDVMCDTYADWLKGANEMIMRATTEAVEIHRAEIDPEECLKWAKSKGRKVDGHARSEFAGLDIGRSFARPYEPPTAWPTPKQMHKDMRELKNMGANFSDLYEPYLRRPKAAVCPIFRVTEDSIEQFGSGVLLRFGAYRFLITAAHVLDEIEKNELLIPGREQLIPMAGSYAWTPLPSTGSRCHDKRDVAYFRFTNADELDEELVFLDGGDCDPSDVTAADDPYTIVGFPAEESSTMADKASTRVSAFSGDGVADYRYRTLKLDPSHHILVQFRMKRAFHYTTMQQGKHPKLEGVSGGGVFAWDKALPAPTALGQPKLVGIVTEYHPRSHVFVVTRLHVLLSAMHRNIPDLPFGYASFPSKK